MIRKRRRRRGTRAREGEEKRPSRRNRSECFKKNELTCDLIVRRDSFVYKAQTIYVISRSDA